MASSFSIKNDTSTGEFSFVPVIFISVLFHIFVFFVVPLATKFLWQPKQYIRPPTFQLVQVPQPKARVTPKKKAVKRVKKKAKRAVPQTKGRVNPAKTKPVEEEDLSELEDLLNEIPPPISQLNVGKPFKYDYYIRNIQSKVERNWKPSINDGSLSVVLKFTIFRNGSISAVTISKSSGHSTLDNLGVRAITLAAPFGKLPHGYPDTRIDLTYTLIPAAR